MGGLTSALVQSPLDATLSEEAGSLLGFISLFVCFLVVVWLFFQTEGCTTHLFIFNLTRFIEPQGRSRLGANQGRRFMLVLLLPRPSLSVLSTDFPQETCAKRTPVKGQSESA